MTFYPDLSTESQIAAGAFVRAIGWLSSERPFPRGEAAPGLVARLGLFREHWGESTVALSWAVAGGPHTCDLCERHRDSANFGVPAGDILYVCPGMVGHYVEEHEYAPPEEFVQAVFASPLPGTLEYALAASPFSTVLGSKTPALRSLVCHLRAMLGKDRFGAYPSPGRSDVIWLGDFNVRGRQARVRVQQCADGERFDVELGHGPRHDQKEFVAVRSYEGLTNGELAAVIDTEFAIREQRPQSRGRG